MAIILRSHHPLDIIYSLMGIYTLGSNACLDCKSVSEAFAKLHQVYGHLTITSMFMLPILMDHS